jgi:membrane-associated phospholipid phosphatase
LSQNSATYYNRYFIIPFILWIITGGIALIFFDKEILFTTVNTHHSPQLDIVMYVVTHLGEGAIIALVLILLLGVSYLRNWWYFIAAVLTNILPTAFIQIIKGSYYAPRPLKYFNNAEWIHTLPHWQRLMERSFPSGHSCGAFCLFCFLSFLLPSRYRVWGLVFFVLALTVAYSRIYLAAHFFLDVYVGSIIGTLFTVFIMSFMRRYKSYFSKNLE